MVGVLPEPPLGFATTIVTGRRNAVAAVARAIRSEPLGAARAQPQHTADAALGRSLPRQRQRLHQLVGAVGHLALLRCVLAGDALREEVLGGRRQLLAALRRATGGRSPGAL